MFEAIENNGLNEVENEEKEIVTSTAEEITQQEEIDPEADACEFASEKFGLKPGDTLAIIEVFKASLAKVQPRKTDRGPSLYSAAVEIIRRAMEADPQKAGVIGLNSAEILEGIKNSEFAAQLSCFRGEGKKPINTLTSGLYTRYKKDGANAPAVPSIARGYWIVK